MIRRECLNFFCGHWKKGSINQVWMSLNRVFSSSSYCIHSPLGPGNERFMFPRNVWAAARSGLGVYSNTALRLKASLDSHDSAFIRIHDDLGKARAAVPFHELVNESDVGLREHRSPTFANGQGAIKHGSPLGYLERSLPEKMVVAVDVDEVLGSFLAALNKFVAARYSSDHSVSDFYVYEFFKIWNCSRAEADIRVHEFFESTYFKTGIHPIPGAQRILQKLSPFCNLSVVTSRQNVIKDHTLEWLERYYPGLFQEIHFGNHFALDGKSRAKSEICRDLGAHVLIDDNPRYAIDCAEAGIKVLLFDYNNSYPWSKCDLTTSHPLVTKVRNWEEVEQRLVSWIIS